MYRRRPKISQPSRCQAQDCSELVFARNLCSKHYTQFRKGDTLLLRDEVDVPTRAKWVYEPTEELPEV
jgi:hypothetical protein